MTQHSQAYTDYLASPAWQVQRRRRLEVDGHRCQRCGATSELDVHHLTYIHLGHEQLYELITLCRQCHNAYHNHHERNDMQPSASWDDYLRPVEGFIPLLGQEEAFRYFVSTDVTTNLIVMPTGYGKTITAVSAYGILRARHLVNRLLLLVPSDILRQSYLRDIQDNFKLLGLQCLGVLEAEKTEATRRYHQDGDIEVFVTSYQSLNAKDGARWFASLVRTGQWLIVHDEAHHLGEEGEWAKSSQIIAGLVDAKLYLSATPIRGDGRPLLGVPRIRYTDGSETYRAAIEVSIREAVEEGAIREPQGHISHYWINVRLDGQDQLQRIDTYSLRNEGIKDFSRYEARRQLRYEHVVLSRILLDTIACLQHKWLDEPGQHQNITFAMTCAHAAEVSAQYNQLEPSIADWVGVTRTPTENKAALDAFRDGTLPILVQVDKITEGFDNPRVSVLTFLHLINSPSKLLQQIGRGLRINRKLPHDHICDIFAPSDTDIAKLIHELESAQALYRGRSSKPSDDNADPETGYRAYEIPNFTVVDAEFIRTDFVNRRLSPHQKQRLEEVKKVAAQLGLTETSEEKLLAFLETWTSGGGKLVHPNFDNETARKKYWAQRVTAATKVYVSNIVRWRALYRDIDKDEPGNLTKTIHNQWIQEKHLTTDEMKSAELEDKCRWLQGLNAEWIENREVPSWIPK